MKVKIEWWRLFDIQPVGKCVTRYNYHITAYNGHIVLSSNQGHNNKTRMLGIAESMFPKAKLVQLRDRYTKRYKDAAVKWGKKVLGKK